MTQETARSLAGPWFVSESSVGHDLFIPWVGTIYYTKEFAEQTLQEILHHAKAWSTWSRLLLMNAGCGSSFLLLFDCCNCNPFFSC